MLNAHKVSMIGVEVNQLLAKGNVPMLGSQAFATFADFWLKRWASSPRQRDPFYIKTWAIIVGITFVLGSYRYALKLSLMKCELFTSHIGLMMITLSARLM